VGGVRQSKQFCLTALLAAFVLLNGCGPKPDFGDVPEAPVEVLQQRDHFSLAIDYLNRLDEFESSQIHRRILYHLNQWIENQEPDADWFADPLYRRLPGDLARTVMPDALQRMRFDLEDVNYLREVVWMRDISRSVVDRQRGRMRQRRRSSDEAADVPPDWLDDAKTQLGEQAVDDLRVTQWLFDWTIRNIQLDEMPEVVSEPAGPGQRAASEDDGKPKRIKKVLLRPGTRLVAWEALMLGHGDALERAKVFILLARQQGIDVVMLHPVDALASEGWLAAALVENQLYLFDLSIGLPVPGPGDRGVATLEQVLADPDLLRALDLDGKRRYDLGKSDIQSMVAWIDAAPSSLSQRMKVLHQKLSGKRKMVLTATPTLVARPLRECKGVADVRLWQVPYQTRRYRIDLDRLRRDLRSAVNSDNREAQKHLEELYDPDAVEALDTERRVLRVLPLLMRGRLLQFRGQFNKRGQQLGAKAFYLKCRPPDAEIAQIGADKEFQRALARINKLPDDPDHWKKAAEQQMELMTRMKQNASYWLGLTAYDNGQYEVARNFFDRLTLKASPDGPWSFGARYNLARAYETPGRQQRDREQLEKAIHWYRAGESPQRHGDLIRAKRLEKLLSELPPNEPPT